MDKYPYIQTLICIQIVRLKVKRVFDVGAYIGGSMYIAQGDPLIDVHGIEPLPANVLALEKATKDLPNYTVHDRAIYGNSGTVVGTRGTVVISFNGDGVTQSAEIDGDGEKSLRVPCMTLESMALKAGQPDLIIFNCEGAEFSIFKDSGSCDVIRGAKLIDLSLHGKSFKFLSQEYAEQKKEINEFLLRSGFTLLYGDKIEDINRIPKGHLRQVWARE